LKNVLLIILASLPLVGCCSIQASGDRYNVDYVTPGMTKEQVVEIMKSPNECVKVAEEEVMIWNGACVSLIDNKVVDKTPLDSANSNYFTEKLVDVHTRSVDLVDEIFGATDVNDRRPNSLGPIQEPTP
jgi:hypothetical protein